MSVEPMRRLATVLDLPVEDERRPYEIVAGMIVEKASPTFEHGEAQGAAAAHARRFGGGPGGGGPVGWWIAVEVDVELEPHELYRPDVAGWRRDRTPERPAGWPVRIRPDWVCEILSPSTAARDLGPKLRTYHHHGVEHVWIVDPEHRTLTVYRHGNEGYVVARVAGADEVMVVEPFDGLPLQVGVLFGVEEDAPTGHPRGGTGR
ncbi:Uma2 family endonuclease [Paraliomyxa miuraensis]|uniref:Uma2 family endonuclease n=1 Tax=Paraliomyxa miuraensis TaxID=376150 RepID=UPI00224E7FE5|nr:Uma2 family endonuclease [Paraliomyxa miuraensis]MCX4239474.1 Uma2 family endonuclease [Paraliomyxa miuraensis]